MQKVKPNRALTTLGLAMKAGRVVSGEFMTESAIKDGRATLVIIADDASKNTKKKFEDSCRYYEVPIIFTANKETLGNAVGKQERASIAVLDEGFSKSILKNMTEEVS